MEPGDKVTYTPTGEKGIVRDFAAGPGMGVYVVFAFNCGGDWENYNEYTAVLRQERHLELGWPQVEAFDQDDDFMED